MFTDSEHQRHRQPKDIYYVYIYNPRLSHCLPWFRTDPSALPTDWARTIKTINTYLQKIYLRKRHLRLQYRWEFRVILCASILTVKFAFHFLPCTLFIAATEQTLVKKTRMFKCIFYRFSSNLSNLFPAEVGIRPAYGTTCWIFHDNVSFRLVSYLRRQSVSVVAPVVWLSPLRADPSPPGLRGQNGVEDPGRSRLMSQNGSMVVETPLRRGRQRDREDDERVRGKENTVQCISNIDLRSFCVS